MIDYETICKKLEVGATYKNFIALFELLGEDTTNFKGNKRKYKIQNLSKYIDFEKSGQKITITDIHEDFSYDIGKSSSYLKYCMPVVISILYDMYVNYFYANDYVYMTTYNICNAIGAYSLEYVSFNHKSYYEKIDALKPLIGNKFKNDNEEQNEYDARINRCISQCLYIIGDRIHYITNSSVLNSLKHNHITTNNIKVFFYYNDKKNKYEEFSDDMTEQYTNLYSEYSSLGRLLRKEEGGYNASFQDYQDEFRKRVRKELNISTYFIGHKVFIDHAKLQEYCRFNDGSQYIPEDNRFPLQQELNNSFCESLLEKASKIELNNKLAIGKTDSIYSDLKNIMNIIVEHYIRIREPKDLYIDEDCHQDFQIKDSGKYDWKKILGKDNKKCT